MVILRKWVSKQAIGEVEEKTEILAIFNRYKNTLKNFIDNLDIEPPDIPRPFEKGLYNIIPSFENPPTMPKLDKNLSNGL